MKTFLRSIAAATIACICGFLVSCEKQAQKESPFCFVTVYNLQKIGNQYIVNRREYGPGLVAFDGKNVLPCKLEYMTFEFLEGSNNYFTQGGFSASKLGYEGDFYSFKANATASFGQKGKVRMSYDNGSVKFSQTLELVLPEQTDLSKGCKAVDLGLSVKWASFNVGAKDMYGFGSYFAWGETKTKDFFDWSKKGDYKWGVYDSGSNFDGMTKYIGADGLNTLLADDDPATANWGTKWRTPTFDEIKELLDDKKCEWTWDASNSGFTVKGLKTGNTIFLPIAGLVNEEDEEYTECGNYWSSSYDRSMPQFAYELYIGSDEMEGGYVHKWYTTYRYNGHMVRAVAEY